MTQRQKKDVSLFHATVNIRRGNASRDEGGFVNFVGASFTLLSVLLDGAVVFWF